MNWVMELFENTGMNKNLIELIESKEPLYGLIYSQSLIEREILKV